MKKIILGLSLASLSLVALAVPSEKVSGKKEKVSSNVASQTIRAKFGDVDNLKWTKAKDNLIRANFTIDGQKYVTFFTADGEYVANTINVALPDLPATIRRAIKEKFEIQAITDMVSYSSPTEEAWFLELAGETGKEIYRVNTNGKISRYR